VTVETIVAIEMMFPEGLIVKVLATWIAFAVALYLALPRPVNLSLYLGGCAAGLVSCGIGFLATVRVRNHLPSRGLGYATLCHFATDVIIQAIGPKILG